MAPDTMSKPELARLGAALGLGTVAALSARYKGELLRQVKAALAKKG